MNGKIKSNHFRCTDINTLNLIIYGHILDELTFEEKIK